MGVETGMQETTAASWIHALFAGHRLLLSLLLAFAGPVAGQAPAAEVDNIPRHPLELKALAEPDAVIAALPAEIAAAQKNADHEQLALLYLAEANACRVIADWACQRKAGGLATAAAKAGDKPVLAVRGMIAEGRGSIAAQDYTRGERLLGDAEVQLRQRPFPELSGDVFLAYSSLSYSLGKNALAAEYSERGLAALGKEPALSIRIRLLRNLARAHAQLGRTEPAKANLVSAQLLSERHSDPKLAAELYLEAARMARLVGDVSGQVSNGRRVLELAKRLRNSQLTGLGREVLGLAADSAGDLAGAEQELRASYESFRALGLDRDELRVLRDLIKVMLRRDRSGTDLNELMARFLERSHLLEKAERAQSSDDFEAKLKYAAQELDVVRLESEAMLARERESALAKAQKFTLVLVMLGAVVLVVLAGFFLIQRHSNRKLQSALDLLGESEARYRMLAENSRDMVVRMRLDGHRLYVSPAAGEILGIAIEEIMQPRWDIVHPDDVTKLRDGMRELGAKGGSATIVYRARHSNGEYISIEASARLVDSPEGDGSKEIVYSGRDITARVRAEQAVEASENFLRGITDNIPASITYIDTQERIAFANAHAGRLMRMRVEDMLGRTVREVRGEEVYQQIRPHVEAALQGKSESFEGKSSRAGMDYYFQGNYIPDIAVDGSVRGFFALTFDITELKNAEIELERLARFDSLTGVSNRRHFDERFAAALSRAKRQHHALALLCLDIDHFKSINDSRGHPAGDAVIREFAARLRACVREEDLVARLGGDEFAVLIEAPSSPADAQAVAVNLMAVMQQDMDVDAEVIRVTTSIGIAYSHKAAQAERLMALADEALYAAKAAGRNAFRVVECG